jgi:hypothetical protein
MSLLDQAPETDPNGSSTPKQKSGLSAILPYTSVALIVAVLYVAWTFYSRSQSAKQQAEEAERSQQESAQKQKELIFGRGDDVKFLVFSAGAHVSRGQSTHLCYGMVNAVKVSIEPAIGEEVKPTSHHCAEISPKQTTTYKITASNAAGQEQSTSLTVRVD